MSDPYKAPHVGWACPRRVWIGRYQSSNGWGCPCLTEAQWQAFLARQERERAAERRAVA